MIEIRPMERDDFRLLDRQPMDEWASYETFGGIGEVESWVGHAFTAVEDGKPIGISGFSLSETGIGRGWLIGSAALRGKPIFLHRTIKKLIKHLRDHPSVKRIEITVARDCRQAQHWAKRLGFHLEETGDEYSRYVM